MKSQCLALPSREVVLRFSTDDVCLVVAFVQDRCFAIGREYRRVVLIGPWFDLRRVSSETGNKVWLTNQDVCVAPAFGPLGVQSRVVTIKKLSNV